MGYVRQNVVNIMRGWVGLNKNDGSYKIILDTYNSIRPLPVNYAITTSDAWCAATVSAAFHKAGYDAIFPSECSCPRMITKAQKMGIWVELDSYIPLPGDAILYDWDDSGIGDNTGVADHIGLVESVSGGNITVIEGNYSRSVKRRTISVNARYIRGYIVPKFDGAVSHSGIWDKDTTITLQHMFHTLADGIVSNQKGKDHAHLPNCTAFEYKSAGYEEGSSLIKAIQTMLKNLGFYTGPIGGHLGINTAKALQTWLKSLGFYGGAIDGSIGPVTVKALQKWLNSIYN